MTAECFIHLLSTTAAVLGANWEQDPHLVFFHSHSLSLLGWTFSLFLVSNFRPHPSPPLPFTFVLNEVHSGSQSCQYWSSPLWFKGHNSSGGAVSRPLGHQPACQVWGALLFTVSRDEVNLTAGCCWVRFRKHNFPVWCLPAHTASPLDCLARAEAGIPDI